MNDDVIFVRPVYEYDSYSDLHRVIQLSGYPLIYVNEMERYLDDQSKCMILTCANGEWGNGWPDSKAKLIHYQIEFQTHKEPLHPGVAEMWTADPAHAKRIHARYIPLGSHPDLMLPQPTEVEKVYDVATLWCPSGRRYTANGNLELAGLSVAPNAWGDERDLILKQSRVMCDVRQHDEHPFIAAQRWCLAAAYRLPIITEPLVSDGIFGLQYCLMSDIPRLGEFVKEWLDPKNAKGLADYGERLHYRLCVEYTFRTVIEASV